MAAVSVKRYISQNDLIAYSMPGMLFFFFLSERYCVTAGGESVKKKNKWMMCFNKI